MLYKISGVTRCTLLMVLYLDSMCQCRLHAVLCSHIGILMRRLVAEPCSTTRLFFPSQCPSESILQTPYSMDWRVPRARPMRFYWPNCSIPTIMFYYFSLHLLSFYRYCGAGVFGLIGCISRSLCLALPTSFNNNNIRFM